MFLQRLLLRNFRNYEEEIVEFSPKLNLFYGANAQGKTSLLEALYFLMTGRSFRTHQISDLIHCGASSFYLEADFIKHDIEQKIKVGFDGKERRIAYNGVGHSTFSSLLGGLQGVTMPPDDHELVRGPPQLRRHFLDLQIAQVDPLYIHYLFRYKKALRQRNHLLRHKNVATLDSWEQEMAKAAAYIGWQRSHAVQDLSNESQKIYQALSGEDELFHLFYKTGVQVDQPQDKVRQGYLEQFQRSRKRELQLGTTLVGPHRDDVTMMISGKEARYFASEGQQRCCVAALRVAEWKRLQSLAEEVPLAIVDDVGASLDEERRERLFGLLTGLGQTFLSSTQDLARHVSKEKCTFRVHGGKLEEKVGHGHDWNIEMRR